MTAYRRGSERDGRAAPDAAKERTRRQMVSLIMLIYLMLLFEGALRKWLLTSYGQLLYFIRDPLVLWVYWQAMRRSLFPRNQPLLIAGVAFGFVGLFWIVLQAVGVASGISKWPLLAAYGWRNYFLYIPLAFVVGEVFKPQELQRLIKVTLALAVPVAVLVMLQFRAAPDAPINVGFGGLDQQFHGLGVDENHTRPMGLFTSDVGQKQFVLSCVAMLLSIWILPASRRFLKSWELIVTTIAVLSCVAVSGSRGTLVGCAIIALAALASAAVLKGAGASTRALLIPTIIALAAAVLYPLVFPEGYSVLTSRWTTAAAVESQSYSFGILGRALYSFVDFFRLLGDTPLAGYGLGLAGNAASQLGVTIPGFTGWAESDWARHIVDLGPILGVTFMIYRVALVTWLALTCFRGARHAGDPLPLLLFAYIGIELLYGQVTGHGTVNGYAWLFAGLCLAASKAPADVTAVDQAEQRLSAAPRFANLMRR
jgi:hypothetical protein